MRLFLDSEFNGFGGDLISMALVADDGAEWYEVLDIKQAMDPWVVEHVLPVLNKAPVSRSDFMDSFSRFIWRYSGCELVADWPADFSHFCNLLSWSGAQAGFRIPLECSMRLLRGSPDISPEIPHNALSDARALRDWHKDWGSHENR
jgi:hypothetical protein